jgi:hypothetical protein
MSTKTKIVVRRASYCKVFSAIFRRVSFSTATPVYIKLAMKPRDSCVLREHCLKYSVFYCTICVTEAELFAMFEFP